MKEISFKNRKLGLTKYGFNENFLIYGIEGGEYDFTDNLNFPNKQDGVYVFFTSQPQLDMDRMDIIFHCTMHYCGKTKDLRERFDQHHHKDDLNGYSPLYIAVAFCDNEEEITNLENRMLACFRFTHNDPALNTGAISANVEAVRI